VRLLINDKEIPRGKDFRFGTEYNVDGNCNLIVRIKQRATAKMNISLIPGN